MSCTGIGLGVIISGGWKRGREDKREEDGGDQAKFHGVFFPILAFLQADKLG